MPRRCFSNSDFALIPVGSNQQHGSTDRARQEKKGVFEAAVGELVRHVDLLRKAKTKDLVLKPEGLGTHVWLRRLCVQVFLPLPFNHFVAVGRFVLFVFVPFLHL